jgi:lipopolysaccharide export system permease protein
MRKTLSIYILKEIVPTFITSLFVLTFVLLIDKILKLTELVINKGVAFSAVLKLFMYIAPSLLVITVPMSLLIAILFAFARFSSDSEIVAMKSCGVSLYKMFPPVFMFTVIMYVVTTALTVYALPYGNYMFKKSIYDIVQNRLDIGIKERVFNDEFKDIVIFANKIKKETGELRGVIISDTRDVSEANTIIADKGSIFPNKEKMEVTMLLESGTIHKNVGADEYHTIKFDSYQLKLSMGDGRDGYKFSKDEKEMTIAELKERIDSMAAQGADNNNEKVEYYKKFSLPVACIVFGIIASPLGISSRRSGKSKGFTIGICVILIYYILLIFAESIGKRGVVPPIVSMWIPNLVVGSFGVYIFYKSANESPIKLFEFTGYKFESVKDFIKNKLNKYF